MKKSVANYIGRRPMNIPTQRHEHGYSVVMKTTGSQVRYACNTCPSVAPWTCTKYLSDVERNRVNLIHQATRKDAHLSTIQRAARADGGRVHMSLADEKTGAPIYDSNMSTAVDILMGDAKWTTDYEGRTPDEGPLAYDMSYPPNSHQKFYEQHPDAGAGIPEHAERESQRPDADHEAENSRCETRRDELLKMTKTELVEKFKYQAGVYVSWKKDYIIERILDSEKF